MMHRYIRSKINPSAILSFGYVAPGGLGEFDSNQYEEVEGELPEGWVRAAAPTDPFITALANTPNPEEQLAVLRLRAIYEQALLLNLPYAMQAIETQLDALMQPTPTPEGV